MGAAATLATGRLDLRGKAINYELLVGHIKIHGSYSLGKLTVLELANNKLCALPPEIGVMTSLTAINCNDNWLKDLPIELRSLNMLRTFLLKGNRLQTIDQIQPWKPMEWKETGQRADLRLDTLEYLQLIRAGHNKLRKLPERLGELKDLRMVVANDNQISVLADKLFTSTTLQALILSANKLTMLPSNIAESVSLRTLVLSYNSITVLPEHIVRLRNLERFHVDHNKLKEIPKGWLHMTKLKHMDLSSNNLTLQGIKCGDLPRLAARMSTFFIKPGNGYGMGPFDDENRGLSPRSMITLEQKAALVVAAAVGGGEGGGRAGRGRRGKATNADAQEEEEVED